MFIKKALSMLLAIVLLFGFSGCRNRNEEEQDPPSEVTAEDELVLYHNNTSLAPMLMSLTEEYSKATGKKISAKLAGNDFMGEIKSQNAALYVVDTHSDLSGWHSGGLFSDFLNDTGLSSLTSKIPAGLHLSSAGIGNYGIPLMLEGYGYIFDKTMLSDIFGEENSEKIAADLKTCSFTEFEGFAAAVDTWITAPSAAEITLNGNKYTFAAEKTGKAVNLTGVFSLNNESTRALEHLLSTGLAAKFASRYEVMTAIEGAVERMEPVLKAYAAALDFQTNHIAGAEGTISRGEEFTGGDYNYSTSIDLFTRGNALFYPGGTSDTEDFEKSSEGFSENLDIIPMKLPLSEEDVTASGMTAEKLDRSIVIGSRYYLAINPKAEEKLSSAARDFITWIYSDEAGKTAYSSAFGGVPFNFEYLTGNSATDEKPSSEAESENPSQENSASSGAKNQGNKTESGTVSPENASPSGTGENDQAGTENENSGTSAENSSQMEVNPDMEGPITPSHSISNSLMNSVAEYYSAGNWIPDLSFALPADFAEKILGEGLSDFWGMETWADSDRKNFVDTIMGGWKERLNKEDAAVG